MGLVIRAGQAVRSRLGEGFSLSFCILLGFAGGVCLLFSPYFLSLPVAAVDLPGHIVAIQKLRAQLLSGSVRFFDPSAFGGWPAFQFYAFLAHLVAAIFSLPLSLVSSDPVRLSVHLILVLSMAALPVSMLYVVRQLACDILGERASRLPEWDWLLTLVTCAICYWFINHDKQWFGIGAAAVMNVGLFSQAMAWHFLLFVLGSTLRASREPPTGRHICRVSAAFAVLFLTHSLTALFALFLAALLWLRFPDKRQPLAAGYALGLALTAFWLVPFQAHSAAYLGQDIHRPSGDLLEIFFRYPIHGLAQSFKTSIISTLAGLDLNNLLVMLLALIALGHRAVHGARIFCALAFAAALSWIVFSSGFVASSITIGLHYYRFVSYLFFLLVCLFAAVPMAFLARGREQRLKKVVMPLIVIGAVISFVSSFRFPHYERGKIAAHVGSNYLTDENAVLAHLNHDRVKGRVLFEYFSDYTRFPFLSAHYMETELEKRTGREAVNGLFIQSSMAYRFPVATAELLGVPGYHMPLLFTDRAKLTPPALAEQLRSFGVSHLVVSAKTLNAKLRGIAVKEPVSLGQYAVLRLTDADLPLIEPVRKKVFGYFDGSGTLPFHLLEFYCYAREDLNSRFELIELKQGADIPQGLAGLIVNGSVSHLSDLANAVTPDKLNILPLHYDSPQLINHYHVWYQHSVELDAYNSVERYLDSVVKIADRMRAFEDKNPPAASAAETPQLRLTNGEQVLELDQLTPGSMYRVNYSYFPYWKAQGGRLFRASAERMVVIPEQSSVRLEFSAFNSWSTIFGYAVSLIALAVWAVIFVRSR